MRLNKSWHLDPHFGSGINAQCICHTVDVHPPETSGREPFRVAVLLPMYPYSDYGRSVVHGLMKQFLEKDEPYRLDPVPQIEHTLIEYGVSIIAFDPNFPDQFFWLAPPRYLWN